MASDELIAKAMFEVARNAVDSMLDDVQKEYGVYTDAEWRDKALRRALPVLEIEMGKRGYQLGDLSRFMESR